MIEDDWYHGVRVMNDVTHIPLPQVIANCKHQLLSGSKRNQEVGPQKPGRKGFKVGTWLRNL